MKIDYIGEHLWAGQLGNIFVLLAFCGALLSFFSYFLATQNDHKIDLHNSWKLIGRVAFWLHSASVLGMVGTLFYMLYNHYFEYEYIWHHSSKNLQLKYIFSCFWEGQEGSFLLWSFWHVILANIVMKTAKDWETPVMCTIALVQAFLISMLLGINLGEYHLGSNPFTVLLRQHPDFSAIPIFNNENYLSKLDGRGLNPLLQNYWMTIHPPTLFLGFAATLIPFAYAIAGLWTKRLEDWQKPAIPWAFFGVMILGTGILMGGAWAYEALSFGGFWAWDPVENASLVPWLTLVGAAHVMIINRNKGGSLLTSVFLTTITFILILYSTFLTRSGILGEASVHAFTDLGMSGQLLAYLFAFLILTIVLVLLNFRSLISPNEEEYIWSREFWMFIGALFLLLSSLHISLATSIPVFNKLFNTSYAPPKAEFYNTWQIPFAIIVALLMGIGQYFKYKKTDIKQVIKQLGLITFCAVISSAAFMYMLSMSNITHVILLFSSFFAVFANGEYFISVVKGNIPKAGASIAHIGFALILLGALLSAGNKQFISQNRGGIDLQQQLGKDFSNNTNILLNKQDTLPMGEYFVSYKRKVKEDKNVYFEVEYFKLNKAGKKEFQFLLRPLVQLNERMGNVAEPDTRHFLLKDIYTHVTYADLSDLEQDNHLEFAEPKNYTVKTGDTVFASNAIIIVDTLVKSIVNSQTKEIMVGAPLLVFDMEKRRYEAMPFFTIKENTLIPTDAQIEALGLKFTFWKIYTDSGKIELSVSEKKSNKKDFIIMEAAVFPLINVLWVGCGLMFIGTLLAVLKRISTQKKKKISPEIIDP